MGGTRNDLLRDRDKIQHGDLDAKPGTKDEG